VHTIAANGVIGDPTQASAEHGSRYWDKVLTVALEAIEPP
jgi:creatinine amidohydrolase/Fe(II)-dependent formamide hydrolase-like protein